MINSIHINPVRATQKALGARPFERLIENHKTADHIPTNEELLLNVTGKAHDILYKANTVFPFDLFPDTVTLDREKLSIINRQFFQTARIISIPIRDINSVDVNIGPFFGSLHITIRNLPMEPYAINYLKRFDAIKMQRMLQGYIIAIEREIDCSEIYQPELINLLNDLGHGEID